MNEVILVRYGEIMLKGLNRATFERKLVSNIKKSLYGLGPISVERSQGRIYIESIEENYNIEKAIDKLIKIFGIVSVSPAIKINNDFEEIKLHALGLVKKLFEEGKERTFKVETKRGNKKFHMDSREINAELGGFLLDSLPSLSVDVNNPSFMVYVEVREFTYIYTEIIHANGGLPVGTNGKAMLLLSGGIDSPVAAWMMAKRGLEVDAIHFYSYPYTSERSKEKVIDLAKIISQYCQNINLYIVPFTDIQLEIAEKCPHDQMTIIMRRIMMMIAEKLAAGTGSLALITGESLGQVASQTIQSLSVTNSSVKMPVFRPLIGMDKNEVISLARKIGTFETSILPYEDCCTVFVAKHPQTKPKLESILFSESKLDIDNLINNALKGVEIIRINYGN
ncbi:MAG TPA: tRNA uracil 4-sulfurtransferase ThiI [Clostridiales bacterium]|nr:tRNA uracil 4-sulfurtransferase ThiI [Clostridiales bacterium]